MKAFGEELNSTALISASEVAVRVSKGKDKFIIIGSAWYKLERFRRQRRDEQFYRFLMDAGLGEKSSLGFGFLNPLKGDKAA